MASAFAAWTKRAIRARIFAPFSLDPCNAQHDTNRPKIRAHFLILFAPLLVTLALSGCRHGAAAANLTLVPDPGGPYSSIAGQSITFDASKSSAPDGTALNFTWDFGDGSTSTGATAVHAYNSAGSFTVTLTVDDGHGHANTATTTVIVMPAST